MCIIIIIIHSKYFCFWFAKMPWLIHHNNHRWPNNLEKVCNNFVKNEVYSTAAFILFVDACLFVCCLQAAKEKETLRRSYFLFIAAVVTNDVIVVLTSQSEF